MIYVIEAPTLRGPFKTRKTAVFSGYILEVRSIDVRPGVALRTHAVTTIPRLPVVVR